MTSTRLGTEFLDDVMEHFNQVVASNAGFEVFEGHMVAFGYILNKCTTISQEYFR